MEDEEKKRGKAATFPVKTLKSNSYIFFSLSNENDFGSWPTQKKRQTFNSSVIGEKRKKKEDLCCCCFYVVHLASESIDPGAMTQDCLYICINRKLK